MLTKNGAIIVDMRGKLGGQVYSKNRYGRFMCNVYRPVNPQTTYQQQNRAYLANVVAAWKQLPESNRLSWNSAAMYLKGYNCFGDSFSYTAYNCFVKCNLVYYTIFGTSLNICPAIFTPAPIFQWSVKCISEQQFFQIGIPPYFAEDTYFFFYATKPLVPGRKPRKSDYRRFLFTPTSYYDNAMFTNAYTAYFGGFPPVGSVVHFKICVASSVNGLMSSSAYTSAVCSSYLSDMTPSNLQQASYNSITKVLSLNANSTAFAHLATIIDASYFSMSFRVLSFGVSNPFRFALSTSPSYKLWNSTDNHYRWSLYTINSAFQCTKQSLVIGQCIAPSNSDYLVLSVKNGTAYVYFGSSLDSLSLISQFRWDASGLYYLNVTNASSYAVQIDSLKLSQ